MTRKEKLEKALDQLMNEYDAFFIENKYGKGTHNEQFEILEQLIEETGDQACIALCWIRDCYDCYYKEEYDNEESAFGYLRSLIKKYE